MPPLLSAVLIVHNEAAHLDACLASVREIADEIVVLDDGSTDGTVSIARQHGARVEVRPFDDFGRQKQAALEKATGTWILSIDADERVTAPLAREIAQVIRRDDAADGYWLRRTMTYLGRRLRFGGAGSEWILRLARRERARFAPLAVHEHLIVDGRTERLSGGLDHLKYRSLREHVDTINRYTELAARRKREAGRRFSMAHVFRIPWEMFSRLVLRLGFLDGRAGVIHAAMAAFYAFMQYAKLWREPE
ncbi:MAG TPA: glycosyltransferase family 2 protein [Gemmatimonadaceae bacterium]|nr:glycosyltransferase family 2 protein [Gemmatimonadaceae bacterium]